MRFKTLHQLISGQILLGSSGVRCIMYRGLDYVRIRSHNNFLLNFCAAKVVKIIYIRKIL